MADGITMTLEGGKELENKMRRLELSVAKKIRNKAVRASAKPVLTAAKANAKALAGPGSDKRMSVIINRALHLKVGKAKHRTHYFIRVQHNPKYNDILVSYTQGSASLLGGVDNKGRSTRGKVVGGKRHYIPNAIEYGHVKRGGSGRVAPNPYLRPAFDSNVFLSKRLMRRELFSGIERAWRVG